MSDTKDRIVKSSLRLFNENGINNVRLQHIADDVGISVGNLAYHFYSKEAIVNVIDTQLFEIIAPVIAPNRDFHNLLDFDTQLSRYYHLVMNYSFYFLDLLEIKRTYSKLYDKRKEYINQIILQVENWFYTNVESGLILAEGRKRQYKIIAHTIWMIITFYLGRPLNHGHSEDSERLFKEVVWIQILPYLTDIGRIEFELMIDPLLDSFSPPVTK